MKLFDRLRQATKSRQEMVLVLNVDPRFRSAPERAVTQMMTNVAWFMLQDLHRRHGAETNIDLDKANDHVSMSYNSREGAAVVLRFAADPANVSTISDFAEQRWNRHLDKAYLELHHL